MKTSILEDDTLSRYEKLELLEDNDIFHAKIWVQHPFKKTKWHDDLLERIKNNPDETGYACTIIDDYFNNCYLERHQTLHVKSYFEDEPSKDDPNYESLMEKKVTILNNRGKPEYRQEVQISYREFLDFMWEWCIENECYGWEMDW